MPEFTKGNWSVEYGIDIISDIHENAYIAQLYMIADEKEREANARLIAEAPVMYDLLGKAFDALPNDHPLKYDIDASLCHVEGTPVPGEDDNDDTHA